MNLVLLFLGILLHGDLRRYVDAIKDSVSSVAGVILQYPFYAGIMAIMVVVTIATGLVFAGGMLCWAFFF